MRRDQALERTRELLYEDGRLTLKSDDPIIALIYDELVEPQSIRDLYGRSLTLNQLSANGTQVPLPLKPLLNITLNSDGKCSGFSGINRYFGKFEIAQRGGTRGVPRRYWNCGIRIEDDVVVTQGGCEVLTGGVPKVVREVEAAVSARH